MGTEVPHLFASRIVSAQAQRQVDVSLRERPLPASIHARYDTVDEKPPQYAIRDHTRRVPRQGRRGSGRQGRGRDPDALADLKPEWDRLLRPRIDESLPHGALWRAWRLRLVSLR